MKKLIIACAAVLVLGLGLTTVGHVLGGQFYSVYYNGALHPFSDAAQNFSDKFVNISDHLVTADDDDDSDFDTDWVQDYLETRRNAIEGYSLPKQSLDHITSIDLTLKGGDFEILYVSGAGTDFTLDGDYSVATSSFTQNGKWTANIWANSGAVTLIIPRDSTSFREIDIACTQSANLFIEDNLSADSIKLSTQDGTLTTNGLYAQNISLHTNTGNISASLLESNLGQCHIQAHTNGGPVTLNGTSLVQLNEDGSGTALYDNRYDTETQSYRLDFSLDLNATVGGEPLSEAEQHWTERLDKALDKLPVYEGTVYRSLSSDMIPDKAAFLAAHEVDAIVTYDAYTSTSTEVYDPDMDIQLVIQSKSGRDMRGINTIEKEILFKRKSRFIVDRKEGDTIWLTEI